MKNKKRLSGQEGQAIMELCVCLIPILVVMLGMIFISGLCISNIQAFVEAKGNAEMLSRYSGMAGGAGDNIHHWDYGDVADDGDGYPFTADDRPVYSWESGYESDIQTLADTQLNMSQDSESMIAQEGSEYIYMPASYFLYADDNFARDLPDSMLTAAELVSSMADSDLNDVFTIDSREFDNYERESLNSAFTRLFGTDISDIDLREMRANTVYYPALPGE